jgi:hypothetical protein
VTALLLGFAAHSLLLEGFGFDSLVELFSADVLLWRLQVQAFLRLHPFQKSGDGRTNSPREP